jgi:hypothetical protein
MGLSTYTLNNKSSSKPGQFMNCRDDCAGRELIYEMSGQDVKIDGDSEKNSTKFKICLCNGDSKNRHILHYKIKEIA